ncbi:MAG: hypothetical protein KF849_01070 [Rhizobiaceae bacterium]|nr:hypothetical protein [Rhizobiaceae bacterium]
MSAGWINLIALAGMLFIAASAIFVVRYAATRPRGEKKPGMAKPGKEHYRQVNPKTGTLFP